MKIDQRTKVQQIQDEARAMAVRYSFDDEESGTVSYEGDLSHIQGRTKIGFSVGGSRL